MHAARILPVVDLMRGQVVRGVGGRRDEYRPIESRLAADPAPATVAAALVRLGLAEAYVADLDAIGGAEPAWNVYDDLSSAGLSLWVDAGLADPTRARKLAAFRAAGRPLVGVIAGLESVPAPEILAAMLVAVGPDRLVFSLDLREGQPLSGSPAWSTMTAEHIAATAIDLGVRSMIVLDLVSVGTAEGPGTLELCLRLRRRYPNLHLISGGGVRSLDDVKSLHAAGCNAVLVASALHDQRITAEDIQST